MDKEDRLTTNKESADIADIVYSTFRPHVTDAKLVYYLFPSSYKHYRESNHEESEMFRRGDKARTSTRSEGSIRRKWGRKSKRSAKEASTTQPPSASGTTTLDGSRQRSQSVPTISMEGASQLPSRHQMRRSTNAYLELMWPRFFGSNRDLSEGRRSPWQAVQDMEGSGPARNPDIARDSVSSALESHVSDGGTLDNRSLTSYSDVTLEEEPEEILEEDVFSPTENTQVHSTQSDSLQNLLQEEPGGTYRAGGYINQAVIIDDSGVNHTEEQYITRNGESTEESLGTGMNDEAQLKSGPDREQGRRSTSSSGRGLDEHASPRNDQDAASHGDCDVSAGRYDDVLNHLMWDECSLRPQRRPSTNENDQLIPNPWLSRYSDSSLDSLDITANLPQTSTTSYGGDDVERPENYSGVSTAPPRTESEEDSGEKIAASSTEKHTFEVTADTEGKQPLLLSGKQSIEEMNQDYDAQSQEEQLGNDIEDVPNKKTERWSLVGNGTHEKKCKKQYGSISSANVTGWKERRISIKMEKLQTKTKTRLCCFPCPIGI